MVPLKVTFYRSFYRSLYRIKLRTGNLHMTYEVKAAWKALKNYHQNGA